MIKADDLRRGNLVNSITHNRLFVIVDSILPSGIVLLQGISTYDHLDEIEPINLNSEVLKQYGFTQRDVNSRYFNSVYYDIQIGNQLYLEIDISANETAIVPEMWRGAKSVCITWKKIEFLHELQNTYYDLTGQHLKQVG